MTRLFAAALMTITAAGCGTLATGSDSLEARYCEVTSQAYDCYDTPQDIRLSCRDLLGLLDLTCDSQARMGMTRKECVEAEIDFIEAQLQNISCQFQQMR